jgi:uncharacterized protein YuzB (UPF0349 family)
MSQQYNCPNCKQQYKTKSGLSRHTKNCVKAPIQKSITAVFKGLVQEASQEIASEDSQDDSDENNIQEDVCDTTEEPNQDSDQEPSQEDVLDTTEEPTEDTIPENVVLTSQETTTNDDPFSEIPYVDYDDDSSDDSDQDSDSDLESDQTPLPPQVLYDQLYKFLETPATLQTILGSLNPIATNFTDFLSKTTFLPADYLKLRTCPNLPFTLAGILQEKCQLLANTDKIPLRCTRPQTNKPPMMFIRYNNLWNCESCSAIYYMLVYGDFCEADNTPLVIRFIKDFNNKMYDFLQETKDKEYRKHKTEIANCLYPATYNGTVMGEMLRYICEKRFFQVDDRRN